MSKLQENAGAICAVQGARGVCALTALVYLVLSNQHNYTADDQRNVCNELAG